MYALRHLSHRDGRLNAGLHAFLFQEVLEREAVHNRAEHAHVVGASTFHASALELGTAEEVSTTDHGGDLYPLASRPGDLGGYACDHVRVNPDGAAAENLT